jgi:hypothetical protein
VRCDDWEPNPAAGFCAADSENSVFLGSDTRPQNAHDCASRGIAAAAQLFAAVGTVACAWCGVQSVDGNHGSLAECVEALKREVERLRQELLAQQRAKEGAKEGATRDKDDDRLPWKFRNG